MRKERKRPRVTNDKGHHLWHASVSERNGNNAYHLLLQLVVLPVDQYHGFLEHW